MGPSYQFSVTRGCDDRTTVCANGLSHFPYRRAQDHGKHLLFAYAPLCVSLARQLSPSTPSSLHLPAASPATPPPQAPQHRPTQPALSTTSAGRHYRKIFLRPSKHGFVLMSYRGPEQVLKLLQGVGTPALAVHQPLRSSSSSSSPSSRPWPS